MQILLNGLVAGSAIALLAIGFQSVYLPTRVFFVGLAGVYTLVPYLAFECLAAGLPWPAVILVVVVAGVGASIAMEWLSHSRLSRKRAGEAVHLIASLGLYIIFVQCILLVWGNEVRTIRAKSDSVTRMGEIVVTGGQWITLGVGVALCCAFALFLSHTSLGLRLRALADNPRQFALFGHRVTAYRYLGFGLAGFFATAASLTTAYDFGFDPHSGLNAVLLAVVAVIIGGQRSFVGPVLGAYLLGLIRAEVVWHFSAQWQTAATFGLLALFLLARPQGIVGRRTGLESTP